ncbi:hypothetical protein CNG01300 [Cryptococcus deneoformans JEC21]|uniref:Chromo domain-containing protein n=1 Tax=Cryptococcus deneoformans (strain JEC21 / ATCC MYA-565) TaxID=214684 RepID=Q5KE93_CRYD1|nr:hypothetical protein CNG01300 [Cryptococcus neoformans var. neoformans JEC21]AAW44506.2 hypothetical protein CNG01300 [Cryptococcus neoformans var. neoformans JEC21]
MPVVKKEELSQKKDSESEESGVEDEYEVEKVIKHRGKGKNIEFLVRWKGYGPEYDTWEPTENVASAEEAVAAYWESQDKTAAAPRKRGRQEAYTASQASITPKPESSKQAAKKARTSTAANGIKASVDKGEGDEGASDDDIDRQYSGNLDKYNDLKNWENVVQNIETVEQGEGGQLIVYATMKGGEKVTIPTEVAYRKCPLKCLYFYQKHLKWRPVDENE